MRSLAVPADGRAVARRGAVHKVPPPDQTRWKKVMWKRNENRNNIFNVAEVMPLLKCVYKVIQLQN